LEHEGFFQNASTAWDSCNTEFWQDSGSTAPWKPFALGSPGNLPGDPKLWAWRKVWLSRLSGVDTEEELLLHYCAARVELKFCASDIGCSILYKSKVAEALPKDETEGVQQAQKSST